MRYFEIYTLGTNGLFTWHDDLGEVGVGDRVQFFLRGKKLFGLVVREVENPAFKTQPIIAVLDKKFIPTYSINLAFWLAEKYFCSVVKCLKIMIPSKCLERLVPLEATKMVHLNLTQEVKVRGTKQKEILAYLKNYGPAYLWDLKQKFSTATLKSLVEKDLIYYQDQGYSLSENEKFSVPEIKLNEEQNVALKNILESEKPQLLWGVTGSGKTEVYKAAAQRILQGDDQMILLLPEIGLTPQLINQFKKNFGSAVAVWHSNLSETEKLREWLRVQTGEAKILIGARSALLVPVPNLKLLIVDEEHEWTYKNEFSPRFWTDEIATMLHKELNLKTIFGSATPRIDSLVKCDNGEWDLLELKQKYFQAEPPEMRIVDLKNEIKKGNYGPISEPLIESLKKVLAQKRQAVLFLNKRGFSGATMCRFCGAKFECDNCSVNMKVHGIENKKLLCHICHNLKPFPKKCPDCANTDFQFKGWGTQQVERILEDLFPDKKILRADSDALGSKFAFDQLIEKFHDGEGDILLGTQMIAKGLDFERVDLVGLILADVGLSLPDFRAEERVFQLLNQVTGRAGRRGNKAEVLIQTYDPEHEVFSFLQNQDLVGFLEKQKRLRQKMDLPPFQTIAKITFVDEKKDLAFKLAKDFHDLVKNLVDESFVLNWAPAFFPRIHNKYHFHVFIQHETESVVHDLLVNLPAHKGRIDVNPVSLL